MNIVVGTAGHIDHGKSSLVRALTGTDPDRLKEEKARCITIELGFAHTTIGDTRVSEVIIQEGIPTIDTAEVSQSVGRHEYR